jgi:glycosyltransferase involved in cell wall biosynthesis
MSSKPQQVLHLPFTYFPDHCGGTEVYVADLCRELGALGTGNVVAAPGVSTSEGEHEGIKVLRFPVSEYLSKAELYGRGDGFAAEGLAKVLDQVKPTIVHFHAMTPAISVQSMRAVRKRGIPMVYTYHTPTTTCMRGTLLRWGNEICDGMVKPSLCGACALQGRGLPKFVALLAHAASSALRPFGARGPTPLSIASLSRTRAESVREWLTLPDRVIALCEWSRRLLLANGVQQQNLRLVRHGVPKLNQVYTPAKRPAGKLRLAFLGRIDPTKGLDVLLEAFRASPQLEAELHVYGITQGDAHAGFGHKISRLMAADARVHSHPSVPRETVRQLLASYDALVVPSLWLETGPLVVLEALAAGVPVLGSGWGGIAEWIQDGVNGLLVSEPTPQAWAAALGRLEHEDGLLAKLRRSISPPRTTVQVAEEVQAVYEEIIG